MLLWPHLGAIRERWERKRRPRELTDREGEVIRLVREGFTNREIADRLVISGGTVRTHLENISKKLGVHTRTAAVAKAFGSSA
jgi:DNA-binding NarL/FixJ family response regulator